MLASVRAAPPHRYDAPRGNPKTGCVGLNPNDAASLLCTTGPPYNPSFSLCRFVVSMYLKDRMALSRRFVLHVPISSYWSCKL